MEETKGNIPPPTSLNSTEDKNKSNSHGEGDIGDKYDPTRRCRTCASVSPSLVPIFIGEGLKHHLKEKIEKYLPIKVSMKDDLPHNICHHCASTLIAMENLLEGCVEAQNILTSLRDSQKDKGSDEVDEVNQLMIDDSDSDDEPPVKKPARERVETKKKRGILRKENDVQGGAEPLVNDGERLMEEPGLSFANNQHHSCIYKLLFDELFKLRTGNTPCCDTCVDLTKLKTNFVSLAESNGNENDKEMVTADEGSANRQSEPEGNGSDVVEILREESRQSLSSDGLEKVETNDMTSTVAILHDENDKEILKVDNAPAKSPSEPKEKANDEPVAKRARPMEENNDTVGEPSRPTEKHFESVKKPTGTMEKLSVPQSSIQNRSAPKDVKPQPLAVQSAAGQNDSAPKMVKPDPKAVRLGPIRVKTEPSPRQPAPKGSVPQGVQSNSNKNNSGPMNVNSVPKKVRFQSLAVQSAAGQNDSAPQMVKPDSNAVRLGPIRVKTEPSPRQCAPKGSVPQGVQSNSTNNNSGPMNVRPQPLAVQSAPVQKDTPPLAAVESNSNETRLGPKKVKTEPSAVQSTVQPEDAGPPGVQSNSTNNNSEPSEALSEILLKLLMTAESSTEPVAHSEAGGMRSESKEVPLEPVLAQSEVLLKLSMSESGSEAITIQLVPVERPQPTVERVTNHGGPIEVKSEPIEEPMENDSQPIAHPVGNGTEPLELQSDPITVESEPLEVQPELITIESDSELNSTEPVEVKPEPTAVESDSLENQTDRKGLFDCGQCGRKLQNLADWMDHMGDHDRVVNVPCDFCGKVFTSHFRLLQHVEMVHRRPKKVECRICGKGCNSHRDLMDHLSVHRNNKDNEDPRGRFVNNNPQNRFNRGVEPEPGSVFVCEVCAKVLGSRKALIDHKKIHADTDDELVTCKICQKTFRRRKDLFQHMLIHPGSKPFKCVRCGKCFARNSYLMGHMRTHTGYKPYSCEYCGEKFNKACHMRKHMKTHLGQQYLRERAD